MTSLVTLTGPPPWGFRLSGGQDFRRPLTVSKVYEWSRAEQADLKPGDVIMEINGQTATGVLHLEAYNIIKNSTPQLTLLVFRPKPVEISQPDPPAQKQIAATKVTKIRSMENGIDKQSQHPPNPPPTTKVLLSSSSPVRLPDRHVFNNTNSYDITKKRYPLPLESEVYKRILVARDRSAAPLRFSFPGSRERNPAPLRSTSFPGSRERNPAPLRSTSFPGSRDRSRKPFQSNTFYLLEEALQTDGQKSGQSIHGRLQSSPGSRNASLLRVHKFHTCETCNSLIVTQAVRIRETRFRHQECYVCRDCGVSLLRRGHFWVGEELYCGKHAQQRYRLTTRDRGSWNTSEPA